MYFFIITSYASNQVEPVYILIRSILQHYNITTQSSNAAGHRPQHTVGRSISHTRIKSKISFFLALAHGGGVHVKVNFADGVKHRLKEGDLNFKPIIYICRANDYVYTRWRTATRLTFVRF